MKKFIVLILILLGIFILGVYIVVPNPIIVNKTAVIPGSKVAITRTIQNKQYWKEQFPNSKINKSQYFTTADSLFYGSRIIVITKQFTDAFDCKILMDTDTVYSHFAIAPGSHNSTVLSWEYRKPASLNPLTRLYQYNQAVVAKKYMSDAMDVIKNSLTNETIYGLDIQETSTTDTSLISMSKTIHSIPTTENIYELIRTLQKYALLNGAQQMDSAIINITSLDSQTFKIMAAIPLDRKLNGNDIINYKLMIPGKFLTATVRGGNGAIKIAMEQMQQYFADYQRTAMAIPYEKLLTNREKEKDSSKWTTRLYFPVM